MSSNLRIAIEVKVQPNAGRSEVVGLKNDVLNLKIAAPPVKGKANSELITFLSKQLGISRGSIALEKGFTSRNKTISITGLDLEEILRRLLSGTRP